MACFRFYNSAISGTVMPSASPAGGELMQYEFETAGSLGADTSGNARNLERWKHVYTDGSGIETTIAIVSRKSGSSSANTVRYPISDHLGSYAGILASAGTPFGRGPITQESAASAGRRVSNACQQSGRCRDECLRGGAVQ
jgi:hypothetical protein